MSSLISSKLLVPFVFTILVLNLMSTIICEPLTSQVLEYLEKDKETFLEYRSQYKFLACKVLTYSRMKFLFEKETIDGYLNQTINKRGFLDYMQENMLNYCTGIYSDTNMEVFEPQQFVAWNTENDRWVNVNMTELIANYTLIENEKKSDL